MKAGPRKWPRRLNGALFATAVSASNGLDFRDVTRGGGRSLNARRGRRPLMLLEFAELASQLSSRIRRSPAAVVMERAALLRAMTAIDDLEQGWRSELARISKVADAARLSAVLEEMLEIDVLLRTWAAFVSCSVDAGRQPLRPQYAASLLSRTLLQQRRRLLTTVIASTLDSRSLQHLDKHRQMCERWTDVLVSVFPGTATTRALQFDRDRCRDFADLWPSPEILQQRSADPVIVTALKSALPGRPLADSPRRDACCELADAIAKALAYDRRTLWTALHTER